MHDFSLSEIDDIFGWVQKHKRQMQKYRSFKEVAKDLSRDVFGVNDPSTAHTEGIIFYLKQYSPKPSERAKCYSCNGGGFHHSFLGVRPGFAANKIVCPICNGSGKDVSGGRMKKS